MTKVYNYFALPPAQDGFCAAAVRLSQAYLLAPPEDLDLYAAGALPQLEAPFLQFFADYEAYRLAAAAWDARYVPGYIGPQPAALAASAVPQATIQQVDPGASVAMVQPLPGAMVQPLPAPAAGQGVAIPTFQAPASQPLVASGYTSVPATLAPGSTCWIVAWGTAEEASAAGCGPI